MNITLRNRTQYPPAVRAEFENVASLVGAKFSQLLDSDGERNTTKRLLILHAYHTTTQQLSDATWTSLNFNSHVDLNNLTEVIPMTWLHSIAATTERFTVGPEAAGLARNRMMRIRARTSFAANATGSRGLKIVKNAANIRGGLTFVPAATVIGATSIAVEWSGRVVDGDVINVQAYQNSGGNLNIGSTTDYEQTFVELEML